MNDLANPERQKPFLARDKGAGTIDIHSPGVELFRIGTQMQRWIVDEIKKKNNYEKMPPNGWAEAFATCAVYERAIGAGGAAELLSLSLRACKERGQGAHELLRCADIPLKLKDLEIALEYLNKAYASNQSSPRTPGTALEAFFIAGAFCSCGQAELADKVLSSLTSVDSPEKVNSNLLSALYALSPEDKVQYLYDFLGLAEKASKVGTKLGYRLFVAAAQELANVAETPHLQNHRIMPIIECQLKVNDHSGALGNLDSIYQNIARIEELEKKASWLSQAAWMELALSRPRQAEFCLEESLKYRRQPALVKELSFIHHLTQAALFYKQSGAEDKGMKLVNEAAELTFALEDNPEAQSKAHMGVSRAFLAYGHKEKAAFHLEQVLCCSKGISSFKAKHELLEPLSKFHLEQVRAEQMLLEDRNASRELRGALLVMAKSEGAETKGSYPNKLCELAVEACQYGDIGAAEAMIDFIEYAKDFAAVDAALFVRALRKIGKAQTSGPAASVYLEKAFQAAIHPSANISQSTSRLELVVQALGDLVLTIKAIQA